MRKKGDAEKALGGSELALLEEENVDWERVWNRSVAGDALPASLRELRCVPSPPPHERMCYDSCEPKCVRRVRTMILCEQGGVSGNTEARVR